MIISQRIAELRAEKELTQQQLATALGVTQKAVDKWESGSEPKAGSIYKLAQFFGVTADYLLGLEN